MPINIPASLTASSLLFVLIFNIVSLSNNGWYTATADGSDYTTYYGLTEVELCNGDGACSSSSYADIIKNSDKSPYQNDYQQTQAGGALAIVFLVLNLLLTAFLLFVIAVMYVQPLSEAIPQISKNPIIASKVLFLPLVVIPLQIVAVVLWVAIFGFYDEANDEKFDISIGAGIALIIVSVVVPIVTFVVCTKVLKGEPSATASPN